MRRYLLPLCLSLLLPACGEKPETPSQEPSVDAATFALGADVSWLSEMEHDGVTFRKADGKEAGLLDVLKDCGLNAIRLRVWVDPPGGWSGKDDMVSLARRVHAAGFALMVDFHYSDFFADPARQTIPARWEADKDDLDRMCAHVADHTREVLGALKAAGVAPAWIQIGNETRNGMLWPAGQMWTDSGDIPDGRRHFARLYNAGYDAAKAVFPDAIVMPHLNNAYEDNAWWFDQVRAAGGKFDAIALSHYPQAENRMTADRYNELAVANIRTLCAKYNLPVIVSEVGVKPSRSDAASVLSSFIRSIRSIEGCKGVFYWEPEVYGGWKPAVYNSLGWNSYDQGAFTYDGRPHEIMNAFKL